MYTIPETYPANKPLNKQITTVKAGLYCNIRVLKGSAPEMTANNTTTPNTSPSIAPASSPKSTAPIIMGIRDSGGENVPILNPLAKVCKTITRAVSMPIPTNCAVLVLNLFIFPPADIPSNLGLAHRDTSQYEE